MSAIYDNWEKLVAAVLKKQQLWEIFHANSRSPSILSEESDFGSSNFSLISPFNDLGFDFSSPSTSSRLQKSVPKLALISDFSPAFDVNDVCGASTELLGRGTFGNAYRATMDNGARIMVKRLKSFSISELDFKRYMKIIGDVRHENVVPLRAYYSSKDEKIMMYDYYSNGSVHSLLHGNISENRTHVDWETRLRIAIGAARGIAELHTQLGGMLIHGNIKASNVFLNPHLYGCISDLGLTDMMETTFLPTARCYAPEVKTTRDVSHASDVYTFGILLLELLTRKSTVNVPGGPAAVDLVKLVISVKNKERAAKVFDPDLLKHPAISDQMVQLLQIGIKCIAKSVKRRPKIFEVVKMFEDIIALNPVIHTSNPVTQDLIENKITFVEDANPTFDLEDLFRASAEVLGKGTLGTCYKVRLENGSIVVVKRLKNVMITSKDFQHHKEAFGRMRHENVDKLRAYFFGRDEKLLVFDYYNHGSLSALLHEQRGARNTPIEWESRLKIAVGAAMGIAYIHMQDGCQLVHGNIKSSNIFLNGQNSSIVSDAGLAKLEGPMKLPDKLSLGYCAPEVTDTTKVSQASDVYSFGVVLLELVSGMPSQLTPDVDDAISIVQWFQSIDRSEWVAEFVDVVCLMYENEEAIIRFLQIATDCLSIVPEHRPRMLQVLKVLEEISGIGPSKRTMLENAWGQSYVESRLEYIMEDLLPVLTP